MKQKILSVAVAAGMVVGVFAMAASAFAIVPTFSQTNVTVGLGQSVTITAQNTGVYMLSNTTPTAVTVSINGSQVTFTGAGLGGSQIALCGVGTASDCTNLYVTVQSAATTSAGVLTFGQNNLSLAVGTNQAVTISGGTGTYSVASNSNTSVVSANVSGNSITITPIAAGSASINVCDTSSNCAVLTVTVNAAGSSSSGTGAVTFGTTNPTIAPGQVLNVSLSGGANYYISLNTNSSISTGFINGTTLAITGVAAGSNNFTICSGNGSGCSTITAMVSGSTATTSGTTTGTTGNTYVNFSNTSPTIAAGQNLNITLSPGYQAGGSVTGYVVLTNQTPSVASVNVNNSNLLSITGLTAGTDVIAVCAQGSGCNSITVTVTGTTAPVTSTSPVVVTTPITTAPTTIVGNTSLVAAVQALQGMMGQLITQMQSLQSQLAQVLAQANAGSGLSSGALVGASASSASAATGAAAGTPYFTETLTIGSQDAQVTALQNQLTKLGFYTGAVTGYYGAGTEAAVKEYQTAHGLSPVGYVGPSTRAALNVGN